MKKYKLKKRSYINWIIVLAFMLVALIFVNIGYSLWSTRLDVFGNVVLELDRPYLDVSVPLIDGVRYVDLHDTTCISFVRDEYFGNSLSTILKANEGLGGDGELEVSFPLRNLSQKDELYVDGKVELIECSNADNAICNVSAYLKNGFIEQGKSDVFNFFADIDGEMIDRGIYYKYEIVYNAYGIKKNFFYTINILPM